jgi:poly [ADP-ribose] polymerase
MAKKMATVVEHRKFSLTCLDNNNNKFWNVTLFDNGDVMSEWGRQGDLPRETLWEGKGRSFMMTKIRQKEKKGYRENKTADSIETVPTTSRIASPKLRDIARKQIKAVNTIVQRLIDYLVGVNAHQILLATGGKITYDTSTAQFSTTQGVIIPVQVSRARDLLDELATMVSKSDWDNYTFKNKLDEYLSLIPRDFGRRRLSQKDILPNLSAVQKENDILDSLDASFAGLATTDDDDKKTKKKKDDTPKVFDVQLELIDDKKTVDRISRLFRSTIKSGHVTRNYNVKAIYQVDISTMKARFDKYGAKLKDIRQLWHGTKASNLLSILRQGLIIPPSHSAHCTGRMYGNGLYFSSISTKALNYATNFWGSGGNTDRTFMFLADVAMGKYHIAKDSWCSYPKNGSDSTWAKGRDKGGVHSGVINDEMIVYNLNQCNLKYLVEFVPRSQYRR